MASLRLQMQNKLILTGVRNAVRGNVVFQQSSRRKHVLCFKTNATVFRNLWRCSATRIVLNSSPVGAHRLASTLVVEVDPQTSSTSKTVVFDDTSLPPVPSPVATGGDAVTETLQTVVNGEPTFESMGLGSWSPVGIVQQCLEYMHVTCGLPWWGSIVVGTVVLRTLVFPLVILAQKNAANMNNNLPQVQVLQMKMTEARQSGNQFESARYAQELYQFMKEKNISPFKSMLPPLAQAPLFISMFMGLRGMTNVPVDSLRTGGLFWFQDLTLPDQFFLLPIITSATLWITIEIGTDTGNMATNLNMMKYFLRAMPIIIFPFTMNFPGAILCYWVSTNFISLIQVGILKIPKVKSYLNIPTTVRHVKENLPVQDKGFVKGFKDSMSNMKIVRELQERENFDQVQFHRAGRAPIQRTFKHDPTKRPAPLAAKKAD